MFLVSFSHQLFIINTLQKKKGLGFIRNFKCLFYECCRKPYVNFNVTKLELSLKKNLFGQPLVTNTLINALKGHFSIKEPKKALVLSFHGSTGVGKNFVTQFVGNNCVVFI